MGTACWMKAKAQVTWEHHLPEGTTALGAPPLGGLRPWEHHCPGGTVALGAPPLGAPRPWGDHHPGGTTAL